ncbi:hypothetical protein [Trichormus variabilis]|uniref:Uncharacterized protein n=1 Tax=Trichormus variabilis SAG 1403-4b TaxID=447716 RepID=A0A3S1C2Z1_ANAVA|nr:hypothetical protein [Trichormus variabilis]MBD2626610.1 hypothetical protein [Trichormus variabilis FACHB-164]RUS95736.1 hypothetical protein DSM107003_29120 [Trichormus variabilis SAG 1403-4b]
MIKAIPTEYNDVQFRSRLEAKWAAFFDILKWEWEYEPCDFDGWIPDFLLKFDSPIFVEVKPVYNFPKDIADEIEKSGCTEDCLIVGMTLDSPNNSSTYGVQIGWKRVVDYEEAFFLEASDLVWPVYKNWFEVVFTLDKHKKITFGGAPKHSPGIARFTDGWEDYVRKRSSKALEDGR